MARKIRVLSLDGGGIRGILPGVILSYIEGALRRRAGKQARLSDYFDLLAGTSTGGILVCGYLIPDGNGSSRPKYTADEVLGLYLERGGDIFRVTWGRWLRSLRGMRDEKYSSGPLQRTLETYFGGTKLNQLLKPCLIASYDVRNRNAKFFNREDGAAPARNFLVRDVARATSAAPTYFETSRIRSDLDVPYVLIDGGIFANNPAMCAYSEARTMDFSKALGDDSLPDKPSAKDMLMLSIGTGKAKRKYRFEEVKDLGPVGWIQPVLDMMMSGTSEVVDYQLKQLFGTIDEPDNYIRLEPDLHDASPDMDDVSPDNVRRLREAGLKFVSDHHKMLDSVVERLLEL